MQCLLFYDKMTKKPNDEGMERMDGRLKDWYRMSLWDVLVSIGILLCTTLLCIGLQRLDKGDEFTSMLFILAVFLIARCTDGYACGIVSALLSVLAVNFAFTYPYFAFNFSLAGYPLAIVCMLAVAIVTSTLTTRIKRQGQLQLEAEREKLRGNLLRAVSHDLRTPLTSILGASSVLLENEAALDAAQRQKLATDIQQDAQWLISMVENLLSVTRISGSDGAKIVKSQQAVEEVVADAVLKFRKNHPTLSIQVRVPDDLLLVPMDPILIGQVLGNLLENAARHGETATQVCVEVRADTTGAIFEISDDGVGISAERMLHLFDGFGKHTATSSDGKRDLGIGLSVCEAIVRSHGGAIVAENKKTGGAVFRFTLPMEEES